MIIIKIKIIIIIIILMITIIIKHTRTHTRRAQTEFAVTAVIVVRRAAGNKVALKEIVTLVLAVISVTSRSY